MLLVSKENDPGRAMGFTPNKLPSPAVTPSNAAWVTSSRVTERESIVGAANKSSIEKRVRGSLAASPPPMG